MNSGQNDVATHHGKTHRRKVIPTLSGQARQFDENSKTGQSDDQGHAGEQKQIRLTISILAETVFQRVTRAKHGGDDGKRQPDTGLKIRRLSAIRFKNMVQVMPVLLTIHQLWA